MDKKAVKIVLSSAIASSVIIFYGIAYFLIEYSGQMKPMLKGQTLMTVAVGLAIVSLGNFQLIKFLREKMTDRSSQERGNVVGEVPVHLHLITFALAETPAIFGFVLAILSASLTYFYPFGILSAIYFIIFWPRESLKRNQRRR